SVLRAWGPMGNAGKPEAVVLKDKWTAVTKDGSNSAHFEHCIAVTDNGPWGLARPEGGAGGRVGEASLVGERPAAVYEVVLENQHRVLAHLVGVVKRNFVRLVPGD